MGDKEQHVMEHQDSLQTVHPPHPSCHKPNPLAQLPYVSFHLMYMSKSLDDTLGLTFCKDLLKSSNVIGRTCVRTYIRTDIHTMLLGVMPVMREYLIDGDVSDVC